MIMSSENECIKCGKFLVRDEKAIYRRLVHRNARQYLCKQCLAEHFKCSREIIEERIVYFKEMGCTLFS